MSEPNLPTLLTLSKRLRGSLTTLMHLHRDADLLCQLATAQNVLDQLDSGNLPDGHGGVITDPDQPVPALDGLTTAQFKAALTALAALSSFVIASDEQDVTGANILSTALALTAL